MKAANFVTKDELYFIDFEHFVMGVGYSIKVAEGWNMYALTNSVAVLNVLDS